MNKKRFFIIASTFFLTGCSLSSGAEQRTLRLTNYGYTRTRMTGLENAVERFNGTHPKVQYKIEFNHYMDGVWDWDRYNERSEQLLVEEGVTDIITIPGEHLGSFAADGYLLPLDDVIEDPRFQEEYFAPLIPTTEFPGHTWGLLVEVDARVAYFNREVLEKLGYSVEEIKAIPEQIRTGEMTLKDVEEIGAEAVRRKFSDYAIVYRPRYGVFYYGMAQAFDAFSIDARGGVIFDEENFAEMLQFFRRNAERNQEPNPTEWKDANDIFIQGRAAVYMGANWTIYDCVMERGGDEETLLGQYIVTLLPAVRKGGSPFTLANTMQVVVSANCENPEDVKEILADAYSDWEALAVNCAQTYRFPVSRSTAAASAFLENEFQNSLMYMLDYSFFMPYMEDNRRWMNALYQAVCSVGNGSGTPEEVARMFAMDIEMELTH